MATKALKDGTLVWSRCRGRNGVDAPTELPDDIAAEAINVVFTKSQLFQKRKGCASQTATLTGSPIVAYNAFQRFTPGQDDSAMELHVIDTNNPVKFLRIAAGTAAASLTPKDDVSGVPEKTSNMTSCVLNDKIYWAYGSGVNRLHVYDRALSTTTVRRVGLPLPAAATVADTGSGAYVAT